MGQYGLTKLGHYISRVSRTSVELHALISYRSPKSFLADCLVCANYTNGHTGYVDAGKVIFPNGCTLSNVASHVPQRGTTRPRPLLRVSFVATSADVSANEKL